MFVILSNTTILIFKITKVTIIELKINYTLLIKLATFKFIILSIIIRKNKNHPGEFFFFLNIWETFTQ